MSGHLNLKKVQLASGGWGYEGRAAAVKLKNGIEVVLMCRTDANLQSVIDDLTLAMDQPVTLDPQKNRNAILASRKDLDLDDTL